MAGNEMVRLRGQRLLIKPLGLNQIAGPVQGKRLFRQELGMGVGLQGRHIELDQKGGGTLAKSSIRNKWQRFGFAGASFSFSPARKPILHALTA
jgi:hypothetical protein